jgi:predicted phage terminase large subunit-like protein
MKQPTKSDPRFDALDELQKRMEAREQFIAFTQFVAPWYKPARHHILVAEKLEQVRRYIETGGKEGIGRLIINEPFRHGKSEQVSRLFPAYLLGRHSDKRVILTSYGADLAEDDSRKVRDYVESDNFRAVFGDLRTVDAPEQPVRVDRDSRKKANWNLDGNRGGVVAAGIGGGIVGKGAHLLVIDDPYKTRDDADSESYRRTVVRWYRSSAYTRLEEGGAIIIIHTRWHPEDLTGDLLKEMASGTGENWEVVFLPALALEDDLYPKSTAEMDQNLLKGLYIPMQDQLGRKAGEALWPEKYNEETLARIRQSITDDEFEPQAQQLPMPARGELFAEQDFKIAEFAPDGLQWYCYVDLALGKNTLSNWNAACPVAMDDKGNLYARDMLRIRNLDEFLDVLVLKMLSPQEQGTVWGVENVNFQSRVVDELMKDKRLAAVSIMPINPNGDKVQRARPIQLRAKQGLLWLVRGAWNSTTIREFTVFPRGKDADQVDSISGGAEMLASYAAPVQVFI